VLRQAGLELPDDFASQWLKALDFAATKSAREQEEHTADDTLAFLVQFYGYLAVDRKLVRQAVDAHYAPLVAAVVALPGAVAAMRALQQAGFRLAVVANSNCDRSVQRMVQQIGLRAQFDIVLTSQTAQMRKPQPQLYTLALQAWDVDPFQAVAVGSRLDEDIAPAQELGLRAVLFAAQTHPSNARLARQVQPDAEIVVWDELWPLLMKWLAADAQPVDDFWVTSAPLEPPPLPADFDPETPAIP
jgi:FMN phosphatase YigB (HAD superfamily)